MDHYFTFPDGGLRYDCAACGQRCCRGKGFALSQEELVPLVRLRPRLAGRLSVRPGGTFAAVNLTDGCWYLRGDGMCEVEVEHGRARKPSTCRLFPFNRVFSVGDVRVIDVNSHLCPVAAAGGGGVRHEEILRDLAELSGSPLLATSAPLPEGLAADWLDRERAAAHAARAHEADPDALARATGHAGAAAVAARWGRLYCMAPDEQAASEGGVAPAVALLLPSLRWNRIFRKQAAPYERTIAHLPLRSRALTFLCALAGRPLSLRGVTELWEGQGRILDVLERWDDPVRVTAPRFDADVPPLLQGVLGVLLAGAFRGGRTLGGLIEEAAQRLEPAERPLAVALAASQMGTLFADEPVRPA